MRGPKSKTTTRLQHDLPTEQWARLLNHSEPLKQAVQRSILHFLKPVIHADDIVQETLEYAAAHPHQWNTIPKDEIIFYLRRISKYMISNRARKLRRSPEVQVDSPWGSPGMEDVEPGEVDSPVKSIHRTEKIRAVSRILKRVRSDAQKEVLRLVWLKGMAVKDAAKLLGRTEQATSVLLQRAMQVCRRIVRRDSFAGFRVSGETA